MNRILFLTAVLICAYAEQLYSQDNCYSNTKPLSYYAFQKMMREHYSFTVVGTQAPVSGFKVETNKPSITLKGNILSSANKHLITNLELSGGLQNDFQQLFSGNRLDGYFKASIGFNYLIASGNSAKYIMDNQFVKMMIRKKVCENREDISKKIDSMIVLKAFEDHANTVPLSLADFINYVVVLSQLDENKINGYSRTINDANYYNRLIVAMIVKYGGDRSLNDNAMFVDFIQKLRISDNASLKSGVMMNDIERASSFRNDRKHKYRLKDDFEIAAYKDIWTSKSISWFNLSFTGINSAFRTYDAGLNSLSDTTSFLPSMSFTYNYLKRRKEANRYLYFRTGIVLRRVNSLSDLVKFDYEKETIISVSPGEQLKSKKSGVAYRGMLTHGFGLEVPVEAFFAPWTNEGLPGLYGKLQYNYGEPWINKNKISCDIGLVWNVNNADKDAKNILTIIPYMGWTNVLKEYKDISAKTQKKLSELFTVGVKFGVPVNLGK